MLSNTETRRAVVIEDDVDIRGLLIHVLTRQGFEVTYAAAGLPGVEEVRRARPDLVTLDLNLPDLDGLEVCKLLREFSDAFIVMLTARADELDKLTGLDNGADDYISKPFSPKELQSRINALFRRRQSPAVDTAAVKELERATEVQQSLLPKEDVRVDGYDVAGAFRPSRNVGGDFYDWYPSPDGLHLTFADAMGKGMGAALIAATVRAVMRSTSRRQDLEGAFAAASTAIAADLDSSNSFVTLFHARLDAASGTVDYVDAGHGLALHVHDGGTARRLPSGGPPVGAWAGSAWPQSTLTLAHGDSLVVASDGVLDVFDSVEAFTEAVLQATRGQQSAQSASDAILSLAPADSAEDDVTAVVVRRLRGQTPGQERA
ncbi:MAG TPA: SpoIIE family protein phosphatase [Arthrobacter sp.]|jgi:serine phosphatase RsbU (regulator of sigma subunit)